MALQLVSRAAVDGKRPVSKASQTSEFFAKARRLTFAAVAFFLAAFAASTGYAQSSAFAGMAGTWSGPGTVTLDDGSNERIRCRATYKVAGANMEMVLTCASDAYRFNLQAAVVAAGGEVSGHLERDQPQCRRQHSGPRRQRQLPGGRRGGRVQRQHLAEDHRQQAADRHEGRQPVPRRQYFAVEVDSSHPQLSSPAKAGDPVRRGRSLQAVTSLEYWIARSSAQLRTRRTTTSVIAHFVL